MEEYCWCCEESHIMCKHECCEATNVQARMPAANVFDVFNYKVPIMKYKLRIPIAIGRHNVVPTTQFQSPLGRHPNCPQQSWGIKVEMRDNFKQKGLTKKESSSLCVRTLFRFFSPSSAGGISDAAREASSYFCTTNRFTTSPTLTT